jgi:uncharacterized membrane protein YvlD (DUF360 family)/uncharacterized BrkB/YihY/UPF0761 family membrane protein
VNLPMDDLTALAERVWGSFIGRCIQRFLRMEGFDRSLVLASQAFTALIPLLIIVAALAPSGGPELIGRTIIAKFGLTGTSADAVQQLFAVSGVAQTSASVGSALLLLYSGVSFTRRLAKMYRAAWNEEKAGVRGNLFAALGLFVFVAEVLFVYWLMSLARNLPLDWVVALPLSILTGLVPWTSVPYLLMNRQVHWRRLLVGGALTATSMAFFGMATTLYMPDLIDQYTSQFGLFGVTIAIIGWLLGAAVITVASTAIAAEFDRSGAPWTVYLKDRYRLRDPGLPSDDAAADETPGLTGADLVLFGRVVVNWSVMATAVWAATVLVPGINVNGGVLTYLWVSLLFGLVNALLGPLLGLFVPDVTWPRLGLFALAVNGVLLEVTSWLTVSLDIDGLVSSVLGALVISVAIALCEFTLRPFHPRVMSR